jgi:hypothetical protein
MSALKALKDMGMCPGAREGSEALKENCLDCKTNECISPNSVMVPDSVCPMFKGKSPKSW